MANDQQLRRRRFLQLAATAGAGLFASACASRLGDRRDPLDGPDGGPDAGGSDAKGSLGGDATDAERDAATSLTGPRRVGIASFTDRSQRRAAVRRAVELAGGIGWVKTGDRVLIKVAHNSMFPYPATVSPESCGELARMCLEAGAARVTIADVMGIENTLMPGGWAIEGKLGRTLPWDPTTDATVRAFRASGLYAGVEEAVGAGRVGPTKEVRLTSFRELDWRRCETAGMAPKSGAGSRLVTRWLKEQLATNVDADGKHELRVYDPRVFDELVSEDVAGFHVPNLLDEVDHIVNLHRVSTHITSMFTTAVKNWVGIMRPDDRLWMHQLTFLRNQRAALTDPLCTEPPYNEMLAELHLPTFARERLFFADATDLFVSGGPDESDSATYPAHLMLASTDLVAADVVNLAVLRLGVLASAIEGGLGGKCSPVPQTALETTQEFLAWRFGVREHGLMRGTDLKLCDRKFSNWDWIAVRRARELGIGADSPADLGVAFATDGDFAVPPAQRDWIALDAARPPS